MSTLTILYDGSCPICVVAMTKLARLDRASRLHFTNIAAPDFDAARYGVPLDALNARMHVVRDDKQLLVGMAAFRAVYGAVGLGWLVAPTKLPGVSRVFDALYALFARHRMRISRALGVRCPGETCEVRQRSRDSTTH